jgi:hypothetical protein
MKQIVIRYLRHYVDTRSNIAEGAIEYSLSNGTLDRWYV